MKLFLISQTANEGLDTYDSAIVCCEDINDARYMHPNGYSVWAPYENKWITGVAPTSFSIANGMWAPPSMIAVTLIGEAHESVKRGVVLASFNAG
jgi:hypothetical protein